MSAANFIRRCEVSRVDPTVETLEQIHRPTELGGEKEVLTQEGADAPALQAPELKLADDRILVLDAD